MKLIRQPFLGAVLVFSTMSPVAAPVGKGPIGWQVYRELDRLPELTSGVQTLQFSSYDRTGGNNDGFEGTYSCVKNTSEGCVIAEATGAGEIQSIWFTRDGGDVSKTGDIIIKLDGETVLHAPLHKVVQGEAGPPFVFPFVADATRSSGGVYIKVPMPYRERMQVTVQNNPYFYHVSYRSFSDAEGVTTFDPAEPALDVIEQWKMSGTRDPKQPMSGASTHSTTYSLAAGNTATVFEHKGPAVISALRVRIPQIQGVPPGKPVADDGRAFGSGGFSEFTAGIDPAHTGVRIIRRFDDSVASQHARVLIDGELAASWESLASSHDVEWREQALDLPTSVTKDKTSIKVRNEFVASSRDFNECSYRFECRVDNTWNHSDTVDIGPNSSKSEEAHQYRISGETWQGEQTRREISVMDPFLRHASDDILSATRLRMTFDDQHTVDSPLGEFFGSRLGEYPVRALMFGMDTSPDGWYSCWWPMPYGRTAIIQLINDSGTEISAAEVQVTSARDERWRSAAHFRTTSLGGQTDSDKHWPLLVTRQGPGKLVGVTHTMLSEQDRGYLEGDERIFVDDVTTPTMHGTGTEDLYEGAYYFNRGTFTLPTNGNPAHEHKAHGTSGDATGCYRLLIGDQVPFSSSLQFDIEHGHANERAGWYSSTAYWYSAPSVTEAGEEAR
ncbi:MAG: glycoside hydrolase family 172 protein [Candidatus Sumerlaeaceae bacterium]